MDKAMTSRDLRHSLLNAWDGFDGLRLRNPMVAMLGLWVTYFAAIHLFIASLNRVVVPILQLPLGMYLAAQGSVVLFVIVLILFAKRLARARNR
jgi:putative solute:sodium symporter small subunit